MTSQFKLIAEKMLPPKDEKTIVNQTMNYLNTLRVKGAHFWVNEEHPGNKGHSHYLRRRASDIIGIFKGRWIAIEMKVEKDFNYIIKHWAKLKRDKGKQNKVYEHFRDQIEFVELIQSNGGLAFFACSWEQVKDVMIKEGIDGPTERPALDVRPEATGSNWSEVNLHGGPDGPGTPNSMDASNDGEDNGN